MGFQQRLNQLRKERGLSQEDLAEIVGVTRQAVQKWEAGTSRPDMDNLLALSQYFGVTLDYLVTGEGPAAPSPAPPAVSPRCCRWEYEYKSKRTLWGLPLVHIHLRENGLALARGVVAVGNVAVGLVSVGIFSLGLLSLGVLAAGGLAVGCLAVGVAAAGGAAAGILAAGGLVWGWLAFGGLVRAVYGIGGVVSASRVAVGGVVSAPLAIGRAAKGAGAIVLRPGQPPDAAAIRQAVDRAVADGPAWLRELLCLAAEMAAHPYS